jgi:hypothetical protein
VKQTKFGAFGGEHLSATDDLQATLDRQHETYTYHAESKHDSSSSNFNSSDSLNSGDAETEEKNDATYWSFSNLKQVGEETATGQAKSSLTGNFSTRDEGWTNHAAPTSKTFESWERTTNGNYQTVTADTTTGTSTTGTLDVTYGGSYRDHTYELGSGHDSSSDSSSFASYEYEYENSDDQSGTYDGTWHQATAAGNHAIGLVGESHSTITSHETKSSSGSRTDYASGVDWGYNWPGELADWPDSHGPLDVYTITDWTETTTSSGNLRITTQTQIVDGTVAAFGGSVTGSSHTHTDLDATWINDTTADSAPIHFETTIDGTPSASWSPPGGLWSYSITNTWTGPDANWGSWSSDSTDPSSEPQWIDHSGLGSGSSSGSSSGGLALPSPSGVGKNAAALAMARAVGSVDDSSLPGADGHERPTHETRLPYYQGEFGSTELNLAGCFIENTLVVAPDDSATNDAPTALRSLSTCKIATVALGSRVTGENPQPWEVDTQFPKPDAESWV